MYCYVQAAKGWWICQKGWQCSNLDILGLFNGVTNNTTMTASRLFQNCLLFRLVFEKLFEGFQLVFEELYEETRDLDTRATLF
jgi:hypothetical protein